MAEYRLTTAVDVKFALDLRFQFLLNELQEFSRSALFRDGGAIQPVLEVRVGVGRVIIEPVRSILPLRLVTDTDYDRRQYPCFVRSVALQARRFDHRVKHAVAV